MTTIQAIGEMYRYVFEEFWIHKWLVDSYYLVLLELSWTWTFSVASSFQETSTRGSWYSSGFRAKAKSGNVGAVSIILQQKFVIQMYVR